MRRIAIVAVMVLVTLSVMALGSSSTYYVGVDRATHKCFIRPEPLKPGMRLMGIYKSQAKAETAMRAMELCKK
jgi:hypothetical protein